MRNLFLTIIGLVCLMIVMILGAKAQDKSPVKINEKLKLIHLVVDTKAPNTPGVHLLKGNVTYQDKKFPIAFYLFLQNEYFTSKEKIPLITTIHNVWDQYGGSEGNVNLLGEGMALLMTKDIGADTRHSGEWPAIRFNPWKDARFIGLMPQSPLDKSCLTMPMSGVVVELINWVEKNFRVDSDRCFLTGFSFGGTATWHIAVEFPERFAAIIPLSARLAPSSETAPEKLKNMGVWCGVGENDGDFKANCLKMNELFVGAKHPNFHFTIVKGGAHHCYQSIYGNPELWKWLLAQKRKN